ncbi:MAG: histidine kinase, partial [Bryobacteraceae bacterium]
GSPLDKHLNFATNLHIATETVVGDQVAETVVEFARRRDTQIYVSSPDQQPRHSFWSRSVPQQIVRLARDMRVVIVSGRG